MAGRLPIQERPQLAARYKSWRSVVQVQRWWRTIKKRNAQVDPKTIKNCHEKLITTWSVADTRRGGRPSKSRDPGVVQVVQEMFTCSQEKSTRQAAKESEFSFHWVQNVFKNELKGCAWKPHYCQALTAEDCDNRMEFGEVMLAWYEDCSNLFKNILWSDEAIFHIDGLVNRHNCHY